MLSFPSNDGGYSGAHVLFLFFNSKDSVPFQIHVFFTESPTSDLQKKVQVYFFLCRQPALLSIHCFFLLLTAIMTCLTTNN